MGNNPSKCYLKTPNSPGNTDNNDILSDSQCDLALDILKNLRTKNQDRISIGHLNINSIRNKFEMLSDLVIGNIDILVLSETKIDNTFPTTQFLISGFSPPFRIDRNRFGGGILFYVRKDIPARLLSCNFCSEIECLPVELNLHKKKWLVYGTYNPNKDSISSHLNTLRNSLEKYFI